MGGRLMYVTGRAAVFARDQRSATPEIAFCVLLAVLVVAVGWVAGLFIGWLAAVASFVVISVTVLARRYKLWSVDDDGLFLAVSMKVLAADDVVGFQKLGDLIVEHSNAQEALKVSRRRLGKVVVAQRPVVQADIQNELRKIAIIRARAQGMTSSG